jgi:hypothetical protein
MAKCEDYPCCGHTEQDPCEQQWYDRPGAFDTSVPGNEHALCDHENGECDVEPDDDEPDDDEPMPFDDDEEEARLRYLSDREPPLSHWI